MSTRRKNAEKKAPARKPARTAWPADLPEPEQIDLTQIRAILGNVAGKLAAVRRSDELSRFVAAVFYSYLAGEFKTLDQAFALRRRGPPVRNRDRDIEIATAALRIAEADPAARKGALVTLGERHRFKGSNESIERRVEKIATRYVKEAKWELMSEQIWAQRGKARRD
jgi:hypothetical protein